MINQHLQTAIAELQEFIDARPDAREVRKALAVKLVYQGYKYEEIQTILDVSLTSLLTTCLKRQELVGKKLRLYI